MFHGALVRIDALSSFRLIALRGNTVTNTSILIFRIFMISFLFIKLINSEIF